MADQSKPLDMEALRGLQKQISVINYTSEERWKKVKFDVDVPLELRDAIFQFARSKDKLNALLKDHDIDIVD